MSNLLLRAALGGLALISLCAPHAMAADAQTPAGELVVDSNDPASHDPLEGFNRAIFEFNDVLYDITSPIVEITPDPIRGMFKAVGTAATAPFHIVANIATGDERNDSLADIAQDNDVDCGVYLVLPFAGPTTTRDAVGSGLEAGASIATGQVFYIGAGAAANDRIEAEVQIRQLDGALDEYAMARSATLQERGCIAVEEADAPSAFGDEEPVSEEVALEN